MGSLCGIILIERSNLEMKINILWFYVGFFCLIIFFFLYKLLLTCKVIIPDYYVLHLCNIRVRTGPWKPGKSWNLKIWIPGLESPGIWTYRSIFLIISVQEFSRYTSSEIWVYLWVLKVCEFIEKVLEFDIGRSWKVLESEMWK